MTSSRSRSIGRCVLHTIAKWYRPAANNVRSRGCPTAWISRIAGYSSIWNGRFGRDRARRFMAGLGATISSRWSACCRSVAMVTSHSAHAARSCIGGGQHRLESTQRAVTRVDERNSRGGFRYLLPCSCRPDIGTRCPGAAGRAVPRGDLRNPSMPDQQHPSDRPVVEKSRRGHLKKSSKRKPSLANSSCHQTIPAKIPMDIPSDAAIPRCSTRCGGVAQSPCLASALNIREILDCIPLHFGC